MFYVSAQGVDERMINVHYYYYYAFCGQWAFQEATFEEVQCSELRSCVKVEVPVLCSPSLIVLILYVDVVKQHLKKFNVQSSEAV